MSLKKNIIKIWKNKGQIIEGIKNSVFKKEDVEEIAAQRISVCADCPLYTNDDKGCTLPGTTPCCDETKGGCGCSLSLKTRALSSDCPLGKWTAELTEEEEDQLNQQLGI
jgi:hypothetical protein